MSFAFVQGIGVTELLIVLGIVLLIFGPKRLPLLGRQLGSGMREFKDSVTARHERAENEAEADGDDDDAGRTNAQAALGRPAEPVTVTTADAQPVADRDR